MGILTEALASIGEVGHGLAMERRLQGTSARLRGPCGAPPASVLLLRCLRFLGNQLGEATAR
jgi:hypothetical protein